MRWLVGVISLITLATLIVGPRIASAYTCQCLGPELTQTEILERSTTVFSGRAITVERLTEGPHQSRASLEVIEAKKNTTRGQIVDVWANTEESCGFAFFPDGVYLVHAVASMGGRLSTNSCMQNQVLVSVVTNPGTSGSLILPPPSIATGEGLNILAAIATLTILLFISAGLILSLRRKGDWLCVDSRPTYRCSDLP
jgi:hypothetical protein